jgi:hypothetical protein
MLDIAGCPLGQLACLDFESDSFFGDFTKGAAFGDFGGFGARCARQS